MPREERWFGKDSPLVPRWDEEAIEVLKDGEVVHMTRRELAISLGEALLDEDGQLKDPLF